MSALLQPGSSYLADLLLEKLDKARAPACSLVGSAADASGVLRAWARLASATRGCCCVCAQLLSSEGNSFSDVQATADAARRDGLATPHVQYLSKLGNNGRSSQNCERDFHRGAALLRR